MAFAKELVNVISKCIKIKYCRKSVLFQDNKTWHKSVNNGLFNVSQGSFDVEEVSELMGLLTC